LVVSKAVNDQHVNSILEIEQKDCFNYLGSLITTDA